jgi:hypothetical protein
MATTADENAPPKIGKLQKHKDKAAIMMELYQLYSRQKPITSNACKKRRAAQQQQIAIQEN